MKYNLDNSKKRNKIHGSVGEGVLINEGAEAYLESNEIFNNGRGSNLVAKGRGGIVIRVKSGTNPAGIISHEFTKFRNYNETQFHL